MNITVDDVTRLPCMHGAEVVAGQNGLSKTVESVTVMEYGGPTEFITKMADEDSFNSSEIIISALSYIVDDVEVQCQTIRQFHSIGWVGLILYYTTKIDPRLIDVCNELDFPLICMPKGKLTLLYSEAIMEITFEIYRRRQRNQNFSSEILEQLSDLPSHQQTINSFLRVLSNYLRSSVILEDRRDDTINVAAWPRYFISKINKNIRRWIKDLGHKKSYHIVSGNQNLHLFRCPFLKNDADYLNLYLLSYNDEITTDLMLHSRELLQLFIHNYKQNNGELAQEKLIRAILNDEPLHIEKLARLFRIDISVLDQMWIIFPNKEVEIKNILGECNQFLSSYSPTALAGYYMGNLVVLCETPSEISLRKEQLQEFEGHLKSIGWLGELVCCNRLRTVKELRQAYIDTTQCLGTALKIFPGRIVFSYGDIGFAHFCLQTFERMEEESNRHATFLQELRLQSGIGDDLLETLCVFLLDEDANVLQTSKKLFIHINTVKYRLKRITELTGIPPDKMPDAIPLFQIAALHRVVSSIK